MGNGKKVNSNIVERYKVKLTNYLFNIYMKDRILEWNDVKLWVDYYSYHYDSFTIIRNKTMDMIEFEYRIYRKKLREKRYRILEDIDSLYNLHSHNDVNNMDMVIDCNILLGEIYQRYKVNLNDFKYKETSVSIAKKHNLSEGRISQILRRVRKEYKDEYI